MSTSLVTSQARRSSRSGFPKSTQMVRNTACRPTVLLTLSYPQTHPSNGLPSDTSISVLMRSPRATSVLPSRGRRPCRPTRAAVRRASSAWTRRLRRWRLRRSGVRHRIGGVKSRRSVSAGARRRGTGSARGSANASGKEWSVSATGNGWSGRESETGRGGARLLRPRRGGMRVRQGGITRGRQLGRRGKCMYRQSCPGSWGRCHSPWLLTVGPTAELASGADADGYVDRSGV
jgi:hypothetical protein